MENQENTKLTMKDLMAKLEEQEKKIEELEAKQAAYRPLGEKITPDDPNSKIVRKDHPPENGGYIVKMPQPWNGERMGIRFRNGIGIIDEALPDCDQIAHWMMADYGYQILSASEDEVNQIRRMLEGVKPKEGKKTIAEKLMKSG